MAVTLVGNELLEVVGISQTGFPASVTERATAQSIANLSIFTQPSNLPTPYGIFDQYSTALYALYSPIPALSSYTGPLYLARRESDGATLTVSGTGNTYNSAAISAWAAGSDVYLVTAYDQSGAGRALTQPTATAQQKLNLDGPYPTFEFDGLSSFLPATTPLANWLTGATGVSAVILRKADLTNATGEHSLIFASVTSGSAARMAIGVDSVTNTNCVTGRRLDADSLNRAGGFTVDSAWDVEIARYDYANAEVYHSTSIYSEARVFSTPGLSQSTPPGVINIGANFALSGFYPGKIAILALYGAALSDAQTNSITSAMSAVVPSFAAPPPALDWGALAQTGTYTLAPGLTNYTVDAPNGNTPSYSDLESLRYHHHTKVAVVGGRVWVAYSGGASGEEQGGQITEVNSSANSWATSTGPVVVVPPQSLPFQLTGTGDVIGTRISYPRAFVMSGGNLYLVAAIDQIAPTPPQPSSYELGCALVAVLCNSDGTIGAPFLISSAPYVPLAGVTAIIYNATLGPALFTAANLFGTWGGSAPGQTPSAWVSWVLQGGGLFDEPSTIQLSSDGLSLLRIWRKNNGNFVGWLYISKSADGGRTWSKITRTNIPSATTETTGLQLADGRIVVVGNPQNLNGAANRDPLYIATFSGTTGKVNGVLAVRQGLPNTPTYPNGATGGAQYPGIASDGTTLYISYSITKQNIGLTTIPIASLP